jgi:site-specific DNA recombinase
LLSGSSAFMRGIIYCRVSSIDQVAGTSLENQREACLAYAREKDIEVSQLFIERGESATAATRTELIKALDYCRKHRRETAAFIVWKLDRFARNTTDHYALQAELAKYGTRLHSVTEPIINEGPLGRMAEAMLAGYAQFENDIRKQRCEAGMQRKIAEGIWPWIPPIGYVHAKKLTDRRKTRPDEPDPERFGTIQRGLKEFARGHHTISSLTATLNRWGLKTRTGRPIFKQLVERMLKDRFYAAILVSPWTGEEHRGLHEPMITEDEYYRIQAAKAAASNGATQARQSVHPEFPLRQFVRCTCGRGLTGSWHRGKLAKHAYYNCYNPNCPFYNKYIPVRALEIGFAKVLMQVAPDELLVRVFEQATIAKWQAHQTKQTARRTRVSSELRQLERQKSRLLEMRLADEITPKEFMKAKTALECRIAVAREQGETNQSLDLDVEPALEAARRFISAPALTWQEMSDVVHKRRFQKILLPEGLTYDHAQSSFGTPKFSRLLDVFEASRGHPSHLVARVGRYLNPILEIVKDIWDLLRDIDESDAVKRNAA